MPDLEAVYNIGGDFTMNSEALPQRDPDDTALDKMDDEMLSYAGQTMSPEKARVFALKFCRAYRTYYLSERGCEPVDIMVFDLALNKAHKGDWSSMIAWLTGMAESLYDADERESALLGEAYEHLAFALR
jgi:hypothetical protein